MEIICARYDKSLSYCRELFGGEYFIFSLSYAGATEPFRELARFCWESRHRTRYRNHYRGSVVFDITAWAGEHPNEHFEAFLYYLKDNEESLSFVFISQKSVDGELRAAIERLFPVELVNLSDAGSGAERARPIGFAAGNNDIEDGDENVRI